MKDGLRQSMAWLHGWVGLLAGWLLYAVFMTGTSAFFQDEITRWMTPEVRERPADPALALENAVRWMGTRAAGASEWSASYTSKRAMAVEAYWVPGEEAAPDAPTSGRLDGEGREIAVRDTQGGWFLYRFHYDLHYINWFWARWLVGIAAMAMLVAILSGIVTHKKIFADFFLLRLRKGQRSWLDAHNAAGVLFLPFVVMITYTGLVSLQNLYMPWGVTANYTDEQRYFDAVFPYPLPPERKGAAPLAPIGPMIAAAERLWAGVPVASVRVLNPGDRTAQVIVANSQAGTMGVRPVSVTFDGVTGRMLSQNGPTGAARSTESVMIGLHAGRYAQPVLRWLYFLAGAAGTAMVATGLVLWTVKRRARLPDPSRPYFGFRLIERLNIGTITGLPIGIATYFHANRLMPLGLEGRVDWEIHAMFIAWACAYGWAAVRPARRGWIELLGLVAVLFALVPVVNAVTTDRPFWVSLAQGDMAFVGFELVMLAIAGVLAFAARAAARAGAQPTRSRRTAAPATQAVTA